MPTRKLSPIFFLLAIASGASLAAAEAERRQTPSPIAGQSWYSEKERGWFWYEEPAPEPELEELQPPPEVVAVPAKAAPAEPDLPPTGSVAWLQIMIPRLKEAAIDDPSEANVAAFYYAQRLMMDKAERFSRASVETLKNEPLLDEDLRYPTSNAASDALATAAAIQKDSLLKLIADEAALMIFFKGSDCVLCAQAISALSGLEHKYGFTIIPVSLDGESLPGGKYLNTQYDNGLAEHLGIITTPAIAMAVPPNEVRIISYSTISMEAAGNRILSAAKDVGLISPGELSSTSRLAQIGLIDPADMASAPADPTESPTDFISVMRDAAARAFDLSNGD